MKRKIALLLVFCVLASLAPVAISEPSVSEATAIANEAGSGLNDIVDQPSANEGDLAAGLADPNELELPRMDDLDLPELSFGSGETAEEGEETQPTDPREQVLAPEETEDADEASRTEAKQGGVPAKLELGVKEKYTLNTKKLGKSITYKSSKPKIASVSAKGVITGLKTGSATVTCYSGKKKVATCVVKVVAAPKKVTLKPKTVTLGVKETWTLTPTVTKGTHASYTWSVKNKKIATVTQTGVVKGVKAGKTTVTVTTHNGKKATVTVQVLKAPSKVTLPSEITLGVKQTQTLEPTITKNTHTTFTWTVKNKKIATVTQDGVVKGVKVGKTTVTVTTHNGKKATVTVQVLKAPTKVTLPAEIALGLKESLTLEPTITKNTHAGYTWSVKNKKIATVTQDGVIKGVKTGKTTVTVTTHNGLKATATVQVLKAPTKVTLDTTSAMLLQNKTLQLTATLPKNTASQIAWTSSDEKVATVSETGLVKAIAKGKATITATTFNGNTATCDITVTDVLSPELAKLTKALGVTYEELAALAGMDLEALSKLTDDEIKALTFTTGDIVWKLNANYTGVVIAKYNGKSAKLEIEDKYSGLPVTEIGEGAFEGNEKLESIAMPSTVQIIGKRAFRNCVNLSSMS